jgi:hypothetical protein
MKEIRALFWLALGGLLAHTAFAQPKPLTWTFPIRRPHAGVLLGNGTQGLMVWGEGRTLKITIGRAGFWDHRGGNEFATRTTYQDVKRLLQAGDEEGIKAAFAVPEKSGTPNLGHPQQIGGGRLEITLPDGWTLQRAVLELATGSVNVFAKKGVGKEEKLVLRQAVNEELAWLEAPTSLRAKLATRLVPSWEHVRTPLEKAGVPAPESFEASTLRGFVQALPEDDPLSIGYRPTPTGLALASALGKSARQEVEKLLVWSPASNVRNSTSQFWQTYWQTVPRLQLPDPVLQEIVDYGLYKQACATPPQGVACALQGPFNEEYQLPPWSNDYHFNINIQMIYTPALASNRPEHLAPLWTMLSAWVPQMQQNGEKFFGRKGALLLPHAVDDRCRVVGTFWTGTIDHACTAWMAYLAYQHYRYTMDRAILEKTAWPLLEGAFEGYFAMLEAVPDGKGGTRWSLPVSVSPEYGGSGMKAWGRDASFQLAALHRIARILPAAAKALGKPIDSRWADVDARLPAYTTVDGVWMPENGSKGPRIALWEGQDLVGSHRHHSHLGSLFPFCTVDPNDPQHAAVVKTSLSNWTFKGPGAWSGWCVPWASAIWSRMEAPEAAVMWLRYWAENYLNEGRGTLHNASFQGQSLISDYPWAKRPADALNREIMQLDAGFGALTAVFELLVQNREDVIYVLPAIHRDWKNFSFENIRAEGAFLISAKVEGGKTSEIRVKSLAGGTLKLAHGLGEAYTADEQAGTGAVLERTMQPGQTLVLLRTN